MLCVWACLGLTFVVFCIVIVLFVRAFSFPDLQVTRRGGAKTPSPTKSALDTLISSFRQVLAVPSISFKPLEVGSPEQFHALHDVLKKVFPETHRFLRLEVQLAPPNPTEPHLQKINTFSLLYTWPGSDASLRPILLMSHQDVVPIVRPEKWSHKPFAGEVDEEGFMYARGTLDVKVGVWGILSAIERLVKEGFQPRRTVMFSSGHDEETGGSMGNAEVSAELKRRGVEFEFVLDEGGAIMSDGFAGCKRAIAAVAVGEKGYTDFGLVARDIGGHSSLPPPPPQLSAVGKMARALLNIETHPCAVRTDHLWMTLDHLMGEMPFLKRLVLCNKWLFKPLIARSLCKEAMANALIRTVTVPTMLSGSPKENVKPQEVKANVNVRLCPGDTIDSVQAHFTKVIHDEDVEVKVKDSGFISNPSPISNPHSPQFNMLHTTIAEVFPDVVVAPVVTMGGTDARYYCDLSPNVFRFLPVRMPNDALKRIHGVDERIHVDCLVDVVQFYAQLIRNANVF